MKAVGIDLAGVEARPTGFCLMDENLMANTCILHTDIEIIERTVELKPEVVAVDAPLALPRGRESI